VRRVREAAEEAGREGKSIPFEGDVVVSGASWDAALASVGAAITGVEAVLSGEVRNAFCTVRPPGRDARADRSGGHSLFNSVAIAARHLRERRGIGRVLVVDWGAHPPLGTPAVLADLPGIRVLSVHQHAAPTLLSGDAPAPVTGDAPGVRSVGVEAGADGAAFGSALSAALEEEVAAEAPDFILLSAGLDILAGDPLGALAVQPRDVFDLTMVVRGAADRVCGGRLVSVLEGGYEPSALGKAAVQHLRALAGLEAAPSHSLPP
ncbi:MAG: histone deacetylase, partial [Gemmatimonadetes bacterium]|nr:histone deacetylase [Gemmatimonadota bacterium]